MLHEPPAFPERVPDSPVYNVSYSHSVTFAMSIADLYAELGHAESYARTTRETHSLSSTVKLGPVEYSSEYVSLDEQREWYNATGFSSHKVAKGLKRIRFSFVDDLDLGITKTSNAVVGVALEQLPVDLSADSVTVVHTAYSPAQKVSSCVIRTFIKLPEKDGLPQTRIHETEQNAVSYALSWIVPYLGAYIHRQHMEQYHKLFACRNGASYNLQRWGTLPPMPQSMPDPPPFNLETQCAISLDVPLEEVYDQLGRVENIKRVVRRYTIALDIDVQEPRYSATKKPLAGIRGPFNEPGFDYTTPQKGGLKRARFIFNDIVTPVWPIDVLVTAEGFQIEQESPDFASGTVSILFISHDRKSGTHVRKTRTFSRMADVNGSPRAKVQEHVEVYAHPTLWLPTWLSTAGLLRSHMTHYYRMWDDREVKSELL